jgi:hypothetical protein
MIGERGWKRYAIGALLLAGLLAFLVGPGSAPAASGRGSSCRPPTTTLEADWDISSASLKLVRSGSWTADQGTVSATETDFMSPLRHRLHFKPALSLQTLCANNWSLSLATSTQLYEGFERGGTENVNGRWSESQAIPTATGSCQASQRFTTGSRSHSFVLTVTPHPLSLAGKRVAIRIKVQTPYGSVCQSPLPAAMFDFPEQPEGTVLSQPTMVATGTLERDRGFTLSFSGAVTHSEPWGFPYPIGTARFVLTWSGELTFTPSGCEKTLLLTGRVLPGICPR